MEAQTNGHALKRMRRYQRGMTPRRPSRPVYGYEVECACGWSQRVNGTKREAEGYLRDHVSLETAPVYVCPGTRDGSQVQFLVLASSTVQGARTAGVTPAFFKKQARLAGEDDARTARAHGWKRLWKPAEASAGTPWTPEW